MEIIMDSSIISLREAVKKFVESSLPNLNDSNLTKVTEIIMADQPSELKDLIYFKEDDFLPVLTKMQARKLISYILENFSPVLGNPRVEIIEVNGKSMDLETVSTAQATEESVNSATEESVNSATEESVYSAVYDVEPFNVSQLSNFGENWANDFKIPYDKFPPGVLKHCREGTRPNPDERSHIIRLLAYEISKFAKRPGKKNLEIIVAKLIKRYPKSFQDVIGNEMFGNGYASFLHSLTMRFDNMNRVKRTSLIVRLPETQQKAKKRCRNFQPDNFPKEETEESQTEKQKWLQTQFSRKDQDEDEVDKVMEITFVSQRFTINTVKLVEETIKDWPFLTMTKYLLMHFNAAMSPYEPDWDCIFQSKIPELLGYLRSKITAVQVNAVNTSECSSIAMLQLLCVYFKEVNSIIEIYKECDSVEIIDKDTCPVTPFIAVFGMKSAVVFIEKKVFSQYITPDDAFKVWFASYFVFNLVYPEDCLATMEFIQRGLMKIAPDSSSSRKAINKSLKLVKDLSCYKNMWTV